MMFGDSFHDYLFVKDSLKTFREKGHHPSRSASRLSESKSNSESPPPPSSINHGWLPAPRRLGRRVHRYLFVFVVIIIYISSRGFLRGPVPSGPQQREPRDTLAGYKHRGRECNVSSLDLHLPVGPVCPDKSSMLTAMSSGGRVGKDAPYVPRGCDMQWFDTWKVCDILNRYSQVIVVGDSMLRHVIGALNILVREDLGYGGVTDWNFNEEEKRKCFCNNQFDVHDCSVQGIFSTADVIKNDPLSLVCPKMIPDWNTDLRMEQMVRYPIPDEERRRFEKAIDPNPLQRKAFVLGHGLWNNLEVDQAVGWLDLVIDTIELKTGARTRLRGRSPRRHLPVLLITPNAAGERKPDEWLVSQGNKALVKFEHAMAIEAAKRRVDHLGTWNMSIQATLYDGVHMDMRGNLLKAMMVLNWLNLLEA